jgi:lysylphosphatidylglycerol synthetase-like protein (DUF2156 family)
LTEYPDTAATEENMSKPESFVVGLVLAVACPLLTFVAFWWTTAAIHMQLPWTPLEAVKASALTGLALGLVLDIVYLKRWIKTFYTANIWILAAIYLGLCAVAVAFFMGLPVGTFLLGVGSGAYVGRRHRHARTDRLSAARSLRITAVFAALVTTAAALPIGLLALNDRSVVESLDTLLGFGQADLRGFAGLTLVGVLCVALFAAQYCGTRIAGQLFFALGKTDPLGDATPEAVRLPRRGSILHG